jgi:hypothetical protein
MLPRKELLAMKHTYYSTFRVVKNRRGRIIHRSDYRWYVDGPNHEQIAVKTRKEARDLVKKLNSLGGYSPSWTAYVEREREIRHGHGR